MMTYNYIVNERVRVAPTIRVAPDQATYPVVRSALFLF